MKTLWIKAGSEQGLQPEGNDDPGLGTCTLATIDRMTPPLLGLETHDLAILEAAVGVELAGPLLTECRKQRVPVLVMASPEDEAIALRLLQQGAQDYILNVSSHSREALVLKAQRLLDHNPRGNRTLTVASAPCPCPDLASGIAAITHLVTATTAWEDIPITLVCEIQTQLAADRVSLRRFGSGGMQEILAETHSPPATATDPGDILGAIAACEANLNLWLTGEFCVIEDVERDRPAAPNVSPSPLGALVIVPIELEGQPWGVLVVEQWQRSRQWCPEELTLLQFAAQQIALKLQCALLQAQAQQERQRHDTILNVLIDTTDLYANILGSISDAVFVTNEAGQFTFVCPNVATIFGSAPSDIMALGSIQTLLGDGLFDLDTLRIQQELPNLERRIYDQFGHPHDLLINVKQVDIGHGSVLYTCRDISKRKHFERQLQQSEQGYRQLIEHLPAGLVVHGADSEILASNPRASDLLELTADQMQGKTALDPAWCFFQEDGSPLPLEDYPVNQVIRTGRAIENFVIGVNRPVSNTRIWVLVNAYPLFRSDRTLDRVIVSFVDMTAQKQAQFDLIQSEQRYASLTQAAPVGIFRTDPEGNCTYVNDRWSAISGLSLEQALGQGWIMGLHPDDRAVIYAEWYDAAEHQRPFRLEYRFVNPAREVTWVYGQAVAETDEHGTVTGYVGTVTDITERYLAEERLQENEYVVRSLFELGNIGLAITTVTGEWLRVNPKLCQMLGYSAAELQTTPWMEITHPDDLAVDFALFQKLLQGDIDSYELDKRFIQKTGEILPTHLTISCARHEDGRVNFVIASLQDMRDRLRVETELRESEARYRLLFQQANDLVLIHPLGNLDEPGQQFLDVNERTAEVLGYSRAEMQQLTPMELIPAHERAQVPEELEILTTTHQLLFEKTLIAKDGRRIPVELHAHVFDWHGQATVLAIARDISERKAIQERLQLALSSANQGLYDLNLETDEAIVGREYALMLGYNPDTFVETVTSWRDRVHLDDRAAVAEAYRAYAQGETEQYRAEFRMHTCQGTWIWVLSVGKFVAWDTAGNPIRLLGTHTDITDRKLTEIALQTLNTTLEERIAERTQALSEANTQLQAQAQALHQANQLLTLVMDSIPQRIFWKDLDSRLLGCNRQFAEDLGAPIEALMGKGNYDLCATQQEADFYAESDREVMTTGEPRLHIQETLHRADGTIIYLETNKIPLRNEKGEVIGLLGTYEDITKRRLIEARLKQQLQKERLSSSLMQQMRQTLDLQEIFQLTANQVRQLLGIDQVMICTLDENANAQFVAGSDTCNCLFQMQSMPTSQPILLECYREYLSGKHFAVTHIAKTGLPDCMQVFGDAALDIKAKFVVPIVEHENQRVYGLLIGHACRSARKWQPWELEFLEQISSHLVIAVRQIRLYTQLQTELQQRKQVEQSLRNSEARLQLVTDSVGGCIAYVDAAQRYQFINQTYTEWFGWEKAEILGRTVASIIGAEAYSKTRPFIERVLSGEKVNFETELPYQRGGTRHVMTSLVPEVNPQKQVQGYYVLVTDISDRKRAEMALRASQHFLEQIANASPNLIYLFDLVEMRNLYVNRQIGQVLGYSSKEIQAMGANLMPMLIHPEDWSQFQAYLVQVSAAQDGEVLELEYRMRHQDGTWHWLNSHDVVFARNAEGIATQIIGSAQDITDRKEAEELIQAQARREKLLREITQRIRGTLDLPTIFATACTEIREVLHCDRVGIFQFDSTSKFTTGEFIAEAIAVDLPSILQTPVTDHCFGEQYAEQYRQGRYLIADDIYQDGLSACHAQILEVFQVKACIVIPLLQGAELWGLLCIHQCDRPRTWQSAEIDLVQQLANQMAIAIQQAKFYEQIQQELAIRKQAEQQIVRQLREQQTLATITQMTRESLDEAEVLAVVTLQVLEILKADRVIVFRLYDDGRTRIIQEVVEPNLPQISQRQWSDEVWSPDILKHYWDGHTRIIPDVMDDEWTHCLRNYSQFARIKSKLVAPILHYDAQSANDRWTCPDSHIKIWGLLVVHACHAPRQWTIAEAEFLQQIANQLAIAMRQVTLFNQLQAELKERQVAQQQITERNQELAISNRQLARATRMKDEFLANVSHEIRTPMNAIVGMTKLTLETDLTAKQRNYLAKIDKSAAVLLHIINDILDFSKIEAGKLALEEVPFSLDDILSNLSDITSLQAAEKGLELLFDVDMDMPSDLVGDPLRLGQILLNLVSNAIKFTETGHVLLTVAIATATPDACILRFSVTDTGIGLTAEQQSSLFQAFSQGDTSTTRRFGGTGLGLAISKRLVALMKGKIGVDSLPGRGSTFWFTAQFKLPQTELPAQLPHSQRHIPLHLTGLRVLVVDDNAAARSIFHALLLSFHCEPTVVATAAAAIAAIEDAVQANHPFQVVMVDYVMPETDGIALIQQLRQLIAPQALPAILLVTAHRQRVLKETAYTAIYPILYKPLQPAKLLEALLTTCRPKGDHLAAHVGTPPPQPQLHRPLLNARILLVEDHEINQELAVELLTQAGAIVTLANNGQEAYDQVRQVTFDAVLMDCQMPIMDGYEATRLIRALPSGGQVPIIAMTAHAMQGDRQKCLAVGMNDYLSKPIQKEAMYAAIQRWLPITTSIAEVAVPSDTDNLPSAAINAIELPPDLRFDLLPTFNIPLGLHYVGENQALYVKLLRQFWSKNIGFSKHLQQAMDTGNYSEALCLVHNLKGVAGTLGCEDLQNQAKLFEQSLREYGADFSPPILTALLDRLASVLKELETWQAFQADGATVDIIATEINWKVVLEQACLMGQVLETDLGLALEKLTFLQETLQNHPQASDTMNTVIRRMEEFDLELAHQALQRLIQLAECHL